MSNRAEFSVRSQLYIGLAPWPHIVSPGMCSSVKPVDWIAGVLQEVIQSLFLMEGEDSTAVFHWRESLCTLVRMSLGGKKETMFSKSSGVSKTALRAASVVLLRVWRRGVAAVAALRVALRFCLSLEICTLAGGRVEWWVLIGRSLSILVQPVSPKRAIFCVDWRVCDGPALEDCSIECMVDRRHVAWLLMLDS